MDSVHIANILLTRRCNLKCDYCNIVKNYVDMPESYPPMKFYTKNEISGTRWIEIIKRLYNNNKNIFLILYGGEPFFYDDLGMILDFCNKNDISYTVISNNTDGVQEKIFSIYEELGPYRGFTSSVDPVILSAGNQVGDICAKSRSGLGRLSYMKERGMADDVVAEITVTKESIIYLYDVIYELSCRGIYSSITVIDDQKSSYYDFSNVLPNQDQMIEKDSGIREQFDKILERCKSDRLKIHIPGLLNKLYDVLPSNMRCDIYKDIHNVTIDSDGTFRLCLRIRGVNSPTLELGQVISSSGEIQPKFKEFQRQDYKLCKGCNWTCMMMSKIFSDSIIKH